QMLLEQHALVRHMLIDDPQPLGIDRDNKTRVNLAQRLQFREARRARWRFPGLRGLAKWLRTPARGRVLGHRSSIHAIRPHDLSSRGKNFSGRAETKSLRYRWQRHRGQTKRRFHTGIVIGL